MQCLVELSFYVFSMHYLLGLAFLWPSSLLRLMPFMPSCLLGLQQRVKRLSDLLLSVADRKLFIYLFIYLRTQHSKQYKIEDTIKAAKF